MRVLFLDQFSEPGGAQLCLQDVLREVSSRGWQAEVLAPGAGPLFAFARAHGFGARRLPMAPYANGHKTAFDVLRYGVDMARCAHVARQALRERATDLVYVNGPRILPAVCGIRIPLLFHSHSLLDRRYTRTIVERVLRGSRARVLACSEFAAEPLRSLSRPDAVRVVHNGVADQGFSPRKAGAGPVRVGILGRIAREKGHLDFLRVANAIQGSENVRFFIFGAPLFSDAHYEQTIRTAGAEAAAEFCGWTDNVAQALHNLDMLVVPSSAKEASGRVILEAFSAGTCVLAYPSGGIRELIRHGETGLLAKSSSPEELITLVRTLAADPELRHRLATNGRREWEARFRVERFRSEVCDAMTEAVASSALFASERYSRSEERASEHDGTLSAP